MTNRWIFFWGSRCSTLPQARTWRWLVHSRAATIAWKTVYRAWRHTGLSWARACEMSSGLYKMWARRRMSCLSRTQSRTLNRFQDTLVLIGLPSTISWTVTRLFLFSVLNDAWGTQTQCSHIEPQVLLLIMMTSQLERWNCSCFLHRKALILVENVTDDILQVVTRKFINGLSLPQLLFFRGAILTETELFDMCMSVRNCMVRDCDLDTYVYHAVHTGPKV